MKPADRLEHITEYYFSKKLREVGQRMSNGEPIINLGIGSPDLAPPKEVSSALVKALEHPNAHQYQSYKGISALRKAYADFYQRKYYVWLNPESEILPLIGSKEGIMHISMAFLNPGDRALIPNPGYPTYSSVTRLVGANPLYYDLNEENNWFPDLERLSQHDFSNVKIMWLNYPHMPTGAKASIKNFERLIEFAEKNNILLINDNPYSFIRTTNPLSIFNAKKASHHCLELTSLSKTFNMAGWRMGALIGSETLINTILKVKSNMDSGQFYPSQQGAVAALQLDESWLRMINAEYTSRFKAMKKLVRVLGCNIVASKTGMFIWAELTNNQTSVEFVDALLDEHHIFIAPGSIFGSNGEGYVRFSLCTPAGKIEKAVKRLTQKKV
ncbi:aminotransferase class I/II-fold pyridoxal phosphate-dependent enzyme [Gangjinia marincola]|uniref:Aminotransferase n=1 Tax=Gangjinia marincola TaxID=578463 RepID=A0ABP3XSI1_9FLAO